MLNQTDAVLRLRTVAQDFTVPVYHDRADVLRETLDGICQHIADAGRHIGAANLDLIAEAVKLAYQIGYSHGAMVE